MVANVIIVALLNRTGLDRTEQDRTGQDKTGQERTVQDRTKLTFKLDFPGNFYWQFSHFLQCLFEV